MNNIILKGTIRDISYSHNIQDTEYYKANLIVQRDKIKEDIINLKFKHFSNPYKNGDEVKLLGNVRTFSQRLGDKNKVDVYVFTYFDKPEINDETPITNRLEIDGKICKLNPIRKTKSRKDVIDFIIANNIVNDKNQCLNCYIPCVAWGKLAKKIAASNVGDNITIIGQLQSREFKKKINDQDYEIRIAHEINVNEVL